MNIRERLSVGKQFVIGMVHCLPLPGTRDWDGDMEKVCAQAVRDAKTLEAAGVDALMVENMGDSPFGIALDTAQATALAVATDRVRRAVSVPVGVDAAFCDYQVAISTALVTGGAFVRIPVFVDTVVFHGGIISPCARECILYRKNLGAEQVMILADIQVKHTHMLLPHADIQSSARAAADAGADGIIVTGSAIGIEPPIDMIKKVKQVVNLPVIAGSGVNAGNIADQLSIADGAIIGSSLKEGGEISSPISERLAKEVMAGLRR